MTGAAGHLGEALLRTFAERDQPAVGLDIQSSPFTQFVGSIADRDLVAHSMRGVSAVIHTATLHKPHVPTHRDQQFIDTNITGTLTLLEAAIRARVDVFIFTSTTSTFGMALTPAPGHPAAWITEDVVPVPKNIYGVTKVAAEDLCELFYRRERLPTIVLRTSRFFPEPDDDPEKRAAFSVENAQANELLHRRVDIEDVVSAHLLALDRARSLGFARYLVSGTTPFSRSDLQALRTNTPSVVARLFPNCESLYQRRGWKLPSTIDRVYVNDRARRELGWTPTYDFARVLRCLRNGEDHRSELARVVGSKGYHPTSPTNVGALASGLHHERDEPRATGE